MLFYLYPLVPQTCGHCWVFKVCWHIECSTFTASSFRIWNTSTGIPSPPLALFIVMLSKALTSHSRMSGSRWVITPSWLSGSWRSFLYSFSVYYCHLFLISSASVRSIPFLSFIEPIFAWNVPLISLVFLKRSLVFPILLFSSISLPWMLRKAFLSLLAILWNSAYNSNAYIFPFLLCFSLLFFLQLFVRPPQTANLLFCISFPWGCSWSLSPVQRHEPPSIVHQVLCLSDLWQQIWKTEQWPQDWKRSIFIPIPKKGNVKERSNYSIIALISRTSKVMLKILKARLQQYVNREIPDVQAGFRKGRGTRDQIANIRWIIEKAREFQKNI